MGDWFEPVAQILFSVVFIECQFAGPCSSLSQWLEMLYTAFRDWLTMAPQYPKSLTSTTPAVRGDKCVPYAQDAATWVAEAAMRTDCIRENMVKLLK